MIPTWSRARLSRGRCGIAGLVVLWGGVACSAPHDAPGIDPREYVTSEWSGGAAPGGSGGVNALVQALRTDACTVRARVLAGDAEGEDDAMVRELVRLGHELCSAGVGGAPLSLDPLDRRTLVLSDDATIVGEGYALLDRPPEEALGFSIRRVLDDGRCDTPPATAEPVALRLMSAERLWVRGLDAGQLRVRDPSGAVRCADAADEGLLVGGTPGRYDVWLVGEEGRARVEVGRSDDAAGGFLAFTPGDPERLVPVSVPLTTEPAPSPPGTWCTGFVTREPTVSLLMRAPGFVNIELNASDADPVMVVSGQGDTYCNDDYYGLNPAVQTHLDQGEWDIYIGTYGANRSVEGTLRIY